MAIGRRNFLGLASAAAGPVSAAAKTPDSTLPKPEIVPLWPHGLPEAAPESLHERLMGSGLSGVTLPRIEVYRPPAHTNRRRAVLVIPGGGYQRIAVESEGRAMARWLLAHGFTACVLIYRLPTEGWRAGALAPLQDAQRAIRSVRASASEWEVEAERTGVVGFSAGGHLAGMLTTLGARNTYPIATPADSLASRPAYAGLLYPVVGMEAELNKGASRRVLVGLHPTSDQVRSWSVDKHVTATTPPIFLVHAADDPIVPVENSIRLFRTLRAARVETELHLFDVGGHGFGLASTTAASDWPALFLRWHALHDPEGALDAQVERVREAGPETTKTSPWTERLPRSAPVRRT